QNAHHGSAALLLHVNAIRDRFGRILPAKHAAEDVRLFDLLPEVDVQVTNVVVACGAIAVFDGEAGRIDGNTDTTPCAVEVLGQSKCCTVRQCLNRGAGLDFLGFRYAFRSGRDIGAQIYHQPCQHRGVQARIFLPVHPSEPLAIPYRLLEHMLMADIDFRHGGADALHTCAEAFALTTVEDLVNDGTQRLADPTFRNFRPILGPIRFDQTGARVIGTNRQALPIPEFQQLRIDVLAGTMHHQPAQIAV